MKKLQFVITGAGRGIGLELTHQTLEAGHTVWAWVRTITPELEALAGKFKDHLHILRCDVEKDVEVEKAARSTDVKSIDVLINNAGAYLDDDADFKNVDFGAVVKNFEINTVGPMRVTRALLGKLGGGRVANITSLMGSIEDNTSGGSYAYRISKAALNMFTRSFAMDHPSITALAIHPGWVKTRMGGAQAPTSPTQSAKGILKVILESTSKQSGLFFDFEGDTLPW